MESLADMTIDVIVESLPPRPEEQKIQYIQQLVSLPREIKIRLIDRVKMDEFLKSDNKQRLFISYIEFGEKDKVFTILKYYPEYVHSLGGRDGTLAPMREACWADSPEILKKLIEVGGNVNLTTDLGKTTPLMDAVTLEHTECIKILIENGADTNMRDIIGRTAKDIAIELGYDDILYLL